jgi:hypothetical protein
MLYLHTWHRMLDYQRTTSSSSPSFTPWSPYVASSNDFLTTNHTSRISSTLRISRRECVTECRISLFILLGVFDLWNGLWIILTSAVGTYLIAFGLRGPSMPWVTFIFVMGWMSVSHIIRFSTPDDVIDITGYVSLFIRWLMKCSNGTLSKIDCIRMERV